LRRDNYCLFDRKEKRKQRIWMKEWLKKRVEFGQDRLVSELKLSSIVDYKNYLRMDADTFGELLEMVVTPLIEKNTSHEDTNIGRTKIVGHFKISCKR